MCLIVVFFFKKSFLYTVSTVGLTGRRYIRLSDSGSAADTLLVASIHCC